MVSALEFRASLLTEVDRDLVARASGCTRCDLAVTRQRVVIGSGPLDAQLALVGEAPGRTEDEGGAPFIGASGRLLFRLVVEELGLEREQCYVTNVVKCRPPANRTPRARELAACRPWWLEQRSLMGARVIVTLGNTATRAVLSCNEGISKLRGRAVVVNDVLTVVPTFHPAAALRGGHNVSDMMRADFRIVAELLARGSM